jgi:hypothetical protein
MLNGYVIVPMNNIMIDLRDLGMTFLSSQLMIYVTLPQVINLGHGVKSNNNGQLCCASIKVQAAYAPTIHMRPAGRAATIHASVV